MEKIHDFGKLGKWSEETLIAQISSEFNLFEYSFFDGRSVRVPLIEERYEQLTKKNSYNLNKRKMNDGDIVSIFEKIKYRNDLSDDLQKYRKTLKKIDDKLVEKAKEKDNENTKS